MFLDDLINKEVSGIGFIRDYVELYFDGPILRCLENPQIQSDRLHLTSNDIEWRKELCALIGLKLITVLIDEENLHVELIFDGDIKLIIDKGEFMWGEILNYVPYISGPVFEL